MTDRQLRKAIGDHAGQDADLEVGGVRGLFLRVRGGGSTSWAVRLSVPGKGRIRATLGPYPALGLADARAAALTLLGDVAKGSDPTTPDETRQPLADAVSQYLAACSNRLAARTCEKYAADLGRLVAWADAAGVRTIDDLSRSALARYRDAVIASPKRAPVKGGKRSERAAAGARISPRRVNGILMAAKTFLLDQRRRGKLAKLDREAIEDCLKSLPVVSEQVEFLTPAEIRGVLEAALRHDAATFEETRAEHAGQAPAGSTPRYTPIAVFVLFLVLSGCRRGEALGLRWSDVDLEALDPSGARVGEIHLRGDRVKNRKARTIGLEVAPTLRAMLAAMRLRGCEGPVFGLTLDEAKAARRRLLSAYGAPGFTWQRLRATCSTYLNSSGVYGRAAHTLAAQQLGHAPEVASRHYIGKLRGVASDARTLEGAMQIEAVAARVVASVTAPSSTGATVRRLASA